VATKTVLVATKTVLVATKTVLVATICTFDDKFHRFNDNFSIGNNAVFIFETNQYHSTQSMCVASRSGAHLRSLLDAYSLVLNVEEKIIRHKKNIVSSAMLHILLDVVTHDSLQCYAYFYSIKSLIEFLADPKNIGEYGISMKATYAYKEDVLDATANDARYASLNDPDGLMNDPAAFMPVDYCINGSFSKSTSFFSRCYKNYNIIGTVVGREF
jgi:hypothetical protein